MNRTGISDAVVLAGLYNRARVQGMGFMQATAGDMPVAEAQEILNQYKSKGVRPYFDYLRGRVMKIDVSANLLDFGLYDRDNGRGAGELAVMELATKPEDPHG